MGWLSLDNSCSLIAATNASAFPVLFVVFHSFVRPRQRHSSVRPGVIGAGTQALSRTAAGAPTSIGGQLRFRAPIAVLFCHTPPTEFASPPEPAISLRQPGQGPADLQWLDAPEARTGSASHEARLPLSASRIVSACSSVRADRLAIVRVLMRLPSRMLSRSRIAGLEPRLGAKSMHMRQDLADLLRFGLE